MKEKRKQDRRHPTRMEVPPFLDSAGHAVPEERRKVRDRRLHNVWLELVSLPPGEVPADWGRKMQRCMEKAGLS